MVDPRRIDRPVAGYFRTRTRRNGPWVPAVVRAEPARDPETGQAADRPPTLRCWVGDTERDLLRTWPSLHPISKAEYDALCTDAETAFPDLDLMTHPPRI